MALCAAAAPRPQDGVPLSRLSANSVQGWAIPGSMWPQCRAHLISAQLHAWPHAAALLPLQQSQQVQ